LKFVGIGGHWSALVEKQITQLQVAHTLLHYANVSRI
jgi:hypothetical protein